MLFRSQTALMGAFARFVPQRLLALLGRGDATQAGLGDQIQREMTVVFVDLRSFTSRAEQQSPAATFEFLNQFFAAIVPAIHDAGGVVDKYLGDGLMALFPDAPAAAVQAALGVVERSRELGAGVGVGVHLGPVTLGLVGAAGRMESTVVSDSVNIAARIERLTRRFGADLLISAAVQSQLPPTLQADTRPLGDYLVPGKRQAVGVYEVFAGESHELRAAKRASRDAVTAAVASMSAGDFAGAASALTELASACPNDQVLPALIDECRRREGRDLPRSHFALCLFGLRHASSRRSCPARVSISRLHSVRAEARDQPARSVCARSGASAGFAARTAPVFMKSSPSGSVTTPPASRTMTAPAAMSHVLRPRSQ